MADTKQVSEGDRPLSLTDVEKAGIQHDEAIERTQSEEENDARITAFTPAEQRKIMHRIDRRLVLTLGAMYCISLMDRTNLSAANIAGMAVELKLKAPGIDRYSIITLVFFIPYVIFQPPATVIMRKVGPRIFLSIITLLWGSVMIGFGFVKDWTQMIGLRVVLGVLEAGFFPGCAYLMSTWYSRYELQKRYSIFYLIGSGASAFAGILAYGLMQMSGLAGLKGWRWIFIMEGVITCLLGIAGYFLLVDFPDQAKGSWKFLNDKEVDFVVARIENDRADTQAPEFNLRAYIKNAADLKVWGFASLFGLCTITSYAIAYFLPIILMTGMGFDVAAAQCLVAPPYAAAGIWMFVQAIFADKLRNRASSVIINALCCLIGLPILGFSTNNGARYFGVFLATMGANANIPAILTYQANNIRGQWKRALCSATLVGFGGIGGIIGSTVFRQVDAPGYRPGMMTCIIANGLIICVTLLLTLKF
jgi:MFS family permease